VAQIALSVAFGRELSEFDRLAEQFAAGARTPRPLPMDAYRRGDEFVASFDLPGLAPATIDLTVEQNVLTIKAERRFDSQQGDDGSPPNACTARLHASCCWAIRSTRSTSRPATKPAC
jgi:HSP20 family molecular chaperone IbpA